MALKVLLIIVAVVFNQTQIRINLCTWAIGSGADPGGMADGGGYIPPQYFRLLEKWSKITKKQCNFRKFSPAAGCLLILLCQIAGKVLNIC